MKKLILILILTFFTNCSNETIYSGKILNQEDLSNINFQNKDKLIETLGQPSFIDPIENKYFYFSEKKKKSNIFNKKVDYSYIFLFEFDNDNNIVSSSVYDLKNKDTIEAVKKQTQSNVVKRGLIEKIFGGVGPTQELPSTP